MFILQNVVSQRTYLSYKSVYYWFIFCLVRMLIFCLKSIIENITVFLYVLICEVRPNGEPIYFFCLYSCSFLENGRFRQLIDDSVAVIIKNVGNGTVKVRFI